MKAKYKLILGRRKNYPLNIELEVYKGADYLLSSSRTYS